MTNHFLIPLLTACAAAGLALSLSSCYETKQEFTLNPDGSGKLLHECTFQDVNMGNEAQTPEEALQAAAGRVINQSKGVDAWRDVQFKQLDDGRIWFRGTAYFRKLDALEISNQSMLEFHWQPGNDNQAELRLKLKQNAKPRAEQAQTELTEEQRARKIKEERRKFQQAKPMLAGMLAELTQTATFHLPGKVSASSNFERGEDNSLSLTFRGSRMIEVMETLINDDAWLAKHGFNPNNGADFSDEMTGMIFGAKAPVSATVITFGKPLFDYASEVAEARKQADQLQKLLGVAAIAAPAEGGELKSIRVVGARIQREMDKKLGFNQNPALTLTLLAEFPGSILDITDRSSITTALASDGTDLIKGNRDWDRRINFSRLSSDQSSALFDIDLKLPPRGVSGILEISGTLQYRVAGATKEIDPGIKELKAGAKGSELGAEIIAIKEGWNKNGSQALELKLKIPPRDLKAVHLVVDGVKSELAPGGYSGSDSSATFTLQHDAPIPENAGILIELHDQVKTHEAPFLLENLSLLGEPIGQGA